MRGTSAVYHCMTRSVNGEMLFKDREKEMLRKMLWQVAEFCGADTSVVSVMRGTNALFSTQAVLILLGVSVVV